MIKVTDVKKAYGKHPILTDISFEAKPGECVAIVGKNGCGKTTLMQILAGAIRPDDGEITVYGKSPLKQYRLFKKYIGYVPQETPLLEELSVRDNMKLWGVYGAINYKELDDRFQLSAMERTLVRSLSGGMKKRLSIACALAGHPPIMLMDEPEAALDLYYKDEIREWIQSFKAKSGIVILTTHDEEEILQCDRCLVMTEGRLIELSGDALSLKHIKDLM